MTSVLSFRDRVYDVKDIVFLFFVIFFDNLLFHFRLTFYMTSILFIFLLLLNEKLGVKRLTMHVITVNHSVLNLITVSEISVIIPLSNDVVVASHHGIAWSAIESE